MAQKATQLVITSASQESNQISGLEMVRRRKRQLKTQISHLIYKEQRKGLLPHSRDHQVRREKVPQIGLIPLIAALLTELCP
jgi:hypothetical protein